MSTAPDESTPEPSRPDTPSQETDGTPQSVAIIGLGLLGGSVAMSLRQRMPGVRVIGCARREETRRFATENGIVDSATDDLIQACSTVDLVVVATPVDLIAETVLTVGEACPNVLFTDVGSTKLGITKLVSEQREIASRFVAAHPIAGSEKTGIENSQADLFQGRPIVVTPTDQQPESTVQTIANFWRGVGGRVVSMAPDRHDELLAISSHTPHLMASLVASQLPEEARPIVGTGWLSTTRIAAGDPGLWTAIVAENRDAIISSLKSSHSELDQLIQRIEEHDDDGLLAWLAAAQQKRQSAISSD